METDSPVKKSRKKLWIIIGSVVALFALYGIGSSSKTNVSATAPTTTVAKSVPTTSVKSPSRTTAAPKPKPKPTTTIAPTTTTIPHAQVVQTYEASAKSVTVSQLANDPAVYNGEAVTFNAQIVNFLQDSSGNTGAANVSDPNDPSSLIYIQFDPLINVSKMAKGDTVQIWGSGQGSMTGKNAYGGTIHESAVLENYLTDTTSGYVDNLVSSPQ